MKPEEAIGVGCVCKVGIQRCYNGMRIRYYALYALPVRVFSPRHEIRGSSMDIAYACETVTKFLKYSTVCRRPSESATFGSQPRTSFALAMSGLRFWGSSEGSGWKV